MANLYAVADPDLDAAHVTDRLLIEWPRIARLAEESKHPRSDHIEHKNTIPTMAAPTMLGHPISQKSFTPRIIPCCILS
jgi:hypothetical protein